MRKAFRLGLVLLMLLGAGGSAWALEEFRTVVLQNATGATGNGTAIDTPNYTSIALQVVISNTATVTFEGTVDGTNYVSAVCTSTASTSATLVTTATASGMYQCPVAGLAKFRARVSAWTSGTVTVTARVTTAVLGKKGGGAGGSGLTSLNSQTGSTQTFTDDTNVTIVSGLDAHVITWAGVLAAARGGTGQSTPTDNSVLVGNGSAWLMKVVPDCDNPTTSKMLFDQTTRAWSCGTDQTGGVTVGSAVSGGTAQRILIVDGSGNVGQIALANGEVITAAAGALTAGTVDAAPSDAKYIMQTASSGTSAEQALSSLATGMVKNTTTTGVLSIGAAGTDYTSPSSTESFTNKTIDCSATGMVCSNFPGGSSAPDPTTIAFSEEFIGGEMATDGGTAQVGTLGAMGWSSRHTVSGGTGQSVQRGSAPGTAPNNSIVTIVSANAAGAFSTVSLNDTGGAGYQGLGDHAGQTNWTVNVIFKMGQTATGYTYVGIGYNSGDTVAPTDFIGVRFDKNLSDSNFKYVCKTGASVSAGDFSAAATGDTSWHRLKMTSTVAGTVNFTLYDSAGANGKTATCSTNVPTSDARPIFHIGSNSAATNTLTGDYFSYTRTVAR